MPSRYQRYLVYLTSDAAWVAYLIVAVVAFSVWLSSIQIPPGKAATDCYGVLVVRSNPPLEGVGDGQVRCATVLDNGHYGAIFPLSDGGHLAIYPVDYPEGPRHEIILVQP